MRHYYDLAIDTIVLTQCCGAYAIGPDGKQRKRVKQIVEGEILTCEGCGEHPQLVEEDVAYEN